MRKILSIVLVFILSISFSGCTFYNVETAEKTISTKNAKKFYNKVTESEVLLDLVATDVCATWKDAVYDYNLSTKDVNNAIEKAKKSHSDNILKINELDEEICTLFDKAKDEVKGFSAEIALKQVMTTYSEYKDSILKSNEALNTFGFNEVSVSRDSLDRALQNLYVEL